MGLMPVIPVSRRDAVMNQIRRAIVLGALLPGDKLTEVSLARTLKVSRPTVREALSQFAGEGLLIQEPYKGIRIARHTPQAIMDIALTRIALDVEACQALLDDPTGSRMEAVLQAWREYEGMEFDPDPVVRHETHITFHRALWVASENGVLVRIWPVIEAQITITLAQEQAMRADTARAHSLHKQLVDALLTGDMAQIEAAFRRHTVESAAEFVLLLQASEAQ
jgi:DNA-binding GntR family transcriptional regulator